MIAISYRREDSLPIAGRLYDRLQARFGKQNVFMDFDSIPPGVDFREQIKQTIERSDLVIAVIGPRWLSEQSDGTRRIDDPTDFVRLEIKYALEKGVPVIPLLVDNTLMPKPERLPPELEGLAFRNALPLDSGIDFHSHAERLINGICGLVETSPMQVGSSLRTGETRSETSASLTAPAGQSRRLKIPVWIAMALTAAVGIAVFGWFLISNHSDEMDKSHAKGPTISPAPEAGVESQQSTLTAPPELTVTPSMSHAATATIQASAIPTSPAIEASPSPAPTPPAKTDSGIAAVNKSTETNVKPSPTERSPSSPSKADKLFAGTWEGVYSPKKGDKYRVRLIINESETDFFWTYPGHPGGEVHMNWSHHGPRALVGFYNKYLGVHETTIKLNPDNKTATYHSIYTWDFTLYKQSPRQK